MPPSLPYGRPCLRRWCRWAADNPLACCKKLKEYPPLPFSPQALSTALVSLGEELGSAVADVNELSGAAAGDPASPLGAVVRILNNQLLVG